MRHWRFCFEALKDISHKYKVSLFEGDSFKIFRELNEKYHIQNVYSHQETGLQHTFARDIALKKFFKDQNIIWKESISNGVFRGLENRNSWEKKWLTFMNSEIVEIPESKLCFKASNEFTISDELKNDLNKNDPKKLSGGEKFAHKMIRDFLDSKVNSYFYNISKPHESRYFCSRLSPYLAFGCISTRQVYQRCKSIRDNSTVNKRSLDQFTTRLRWQAHFIQKLEMQVDIEYQNLNSAFNGIREKKDKKKFKSWKNGSTGYPLIDAAMRCVKESGYLNFRLRATVVSFLTHHLWQPWQPGSYYLAKMFLDYEPGIHYSQFQMQAGTTGINTLRIYNPVKQSLDKDPEAKFIKKWVPELSKLPTALIHQPWNITPMEEALYDFSYGVDYPKRIINHESEARNARERLWKIKKTDKSKYQGLKILSRHVNSRGRLNKG